jgi:hypothetical protein
MKLTLCLSAIETAIGALTMHISSMQLRSRQSGLQSLSTVVRDWTIAQCVHLLAHFLKLLPSDMVGTPCCTHSCILRCAAVSSVVGWYICGTRVRGENVGSRVTQHFRLPRNHVSMMPFDTCSTIHRMSDIRNVHVLEPLTNQPREEQRVPCK